MDVISSLAFMKFSFTIFTSRYCKCSEFCHTFSPNTWVYSNFLTSHVCRVRVCVYVWEWEHRWENRCLFSQLDKMPEKGIMCLFHSPQARYLPRHLSDRKFVIQALTVTLASGIEFDCITKHTALHLYFISVELG